MITRTLLVWLLMALQFAIPALAQRKKEPSGPRAVAVVEWTPQGLRLIPISLLIDDRYYDATLYRANPVPMALDPDTVYEVQKSGEAIGDFTVTTPAQLPNGAWIGEGKYESEIDRRKKSEDRAKAAAAAAAIKPVEPKDERPTLKRGSAKTETTPPPATPTPAPQAETAKPSPAPQPPPTDAIADDANRPVLRRGKPAEEQAEKLGKDTLPRKAPPKMPEGINKIQVAVSDAKEGEPRPYTWKWANAEEEKKFHTEIEKMAASLVADYAKKNGGPMPGKLEVTGFHAFDLAYNNEPDVVLTARILPSTTTPTHAKGGTAGPPSAANRRAAAKPAPSAPAATPSGFEYYVTLMAHEDIYGQMQKDFAAITDNKHLDAFPRYELIDAVDVDGDKNGDLLFRRVTDVGSSFVIYRVVGNRVEELLNVPEPRDTAAGS